MQFERFLQKKMQTQIKFVLSANMSTDRAQT